MKRNRDRWMGLVFCGLLAAAVSASPSPAAEPPEGVVVGRVSHVEEDLLRYVPEQKDWAVMVADSPFGDGDVLLSAVGGKAELIVPNGTWIRIGGGTRLQCVALDADRTEIEIGQGVARFSNKGDRTVVKAATPFGSVLADAGTVFDLYVGENGVEAVAVQGTVSFAHAATGATHVVATGSSSVLAGLQHVSPGQGTVDPDWNRWNMVRENFWLTKNEMKGPSAEYLPQSLRHEAYTFEENGRWESVSYEGSECWFWRPTTVAVGWSPFTVGRWVEWHGEQTWIPAEPFGYTTHHYGNWVYLNRLWYWAPPVAVVRIGLPLLDVGFFWSPGRVGWIASGLLVGWVPLAPRETYHSHRYWGGPHTVVIDRTRRIDISIRNYSYADHAVIVPQSGLYGVNDYRNIRVANLSRANIIKQYRATPAIDQVIKNYVTIWQRHQYTGTAAEEKPRQTLTGRIRRKEAVVRKDGKEKAGQLQERLKALPKGRIDREAGGVLPPAPERSGRPEGDGRPEARTPRPAPERSGQGIRENAERPGKPIRPREEGPPQTKKRVP